MSVWRYLKRAPVLAEQAERAGSISTPEGIMRFEAGDYLVTDSPPTHVWPVKRAIFEATYAGVSGADGTVTWPDELRAYFRVVSDGRP
jgi:hypothetical protein